MRQNAAETGPVLFLRQPPYVDVRCVNATIEINVFYMNVDARRRTSTYVDVRCVNATLRYTNFIMLRIYGEALDGLRVRLKMYLVTGVC